MRRKRAMQWELEKGDAVGVGEGRWCGRHRRAQLWGLRLCVPDGEGQIFWANVRAAKAVRSLG